ncbi:radical SAM protein [Thermodesulfobacteriota bacterium]
MIYPANKAFIYLTNRCNQNCRHCYLDSNPQEIDGLKTSDIEMIIDDLLCAGVNRIHFDGGEPFIREDIFHLIDYASRAGAILSFITNGSLVDESMLTKLKGKVRAINFSIDGARAETHDWLRRSKGSFNRILKLLNFATKHFETNVWFVTNKSNFEETLDLPELLEKGESRPTRLAFYVPSKIGRGKDNWSSLGISGKEWMFHLKNMYKLTKKYDWIYYEMLGQAPNILTKDKSEKYKKCNIYRRDLVHIKWDGGVYFCSLLMKDKGFEIGNIKDHRFSRLWFDENIWKKMKRKILSATENCNNCRNLELCQRGCIAHFDNSLKRDYRCQPDFVPLCSHVFYR